MRPPARRLITTGIMSITPRFFTRLADFPPVDKSNIQLSFSPKHAPAIPKPPGPTSKVMIQPKDCAFQGVKSNAPLPPPSAVDDPGVYPFLQRRAELRRKTIEEGVRTALAKR